jgi:Rieske Fe-S protein
MDSDRRKLCQAGGLLVMGAAAGAALPGCGSNGGGGGSCGEMAFNTHLTPEDVPKGTAAPFFMGGAGMIGYFVCQDDNGFYAMDGNCTHRGCFVDFVTASMSFNCHCHGATFDFNGGTPTDPAPTPMPHYELCLSAGEFVIDTSKPVDAAKRYRF